MTEQTKLPITRKALEKDLNLDRDVAGAILRIIKKKDDPELYRGVRDWMQRCHHVPNWHEQAMYAIDELLDNFGVSYVRHPSDSYTDSKGYSYSRSGDDYAATIAYSHQEGEFYIACWEDLATEVKEEGVEEAWDNWVRSEFESAIKAHLNLYEILETGDRFRELFDWACDKSGHYLEMSSESLYVDMKEVAKVVTIEQLDEYGVEYETWED